MPRRVVDMGIAAICGLCALTAAGILAGLVFVVAQRGAPALSWSFFTEQIRLVGAAGGIFWNLIGTTVLLTAAFLICTPVAVGLALVEHVWLRSRRGKRALLAVLYTMNGLPSILF